MLKSLLASKQLYTGFLLVLCLFNYKAEAQGKLTAKPVNTVDSPYGYYEYLPKSYNNKSKHPLLIALHGIGEAGNSASELSRVLKFGPAKLIKEGRWPANRPFIVIAPQSFGGFFNPTKLHDLIEHLKKSYRVDKNRIYLTGLSAGGISIWNYLAEYQDQVAAVVPIAGKGQIIRDKGLCKLGKLPIWAFHGSNDGTVNANGSIIPIEFLRNCSKGSSSTSKLTVYPGVGHDSWSRTYDLSGMSSKTDKKYDPYNVNIYDWLLSHEKGKSKDKEKKPEPEPTPAPAPTSSPVNKDSGSCGCDYTITPQTEYVDAKELGVGPGDVVCVKAGFYRYLQLVNFVGSSNNPITIKNCGGKVTVGDGSWHYGIVIKSSKYFKLTGTGDGNHQYGLLVGGVKGNSGLGIYDLSTDFEVDHLEVKNVGGAGMHILTRPTCDPKTWRQNFTMRNISIHDNYLHDIDGEGMYIGHSMYPGKKITCNGSSKTVYPHSIENIKVYNNITKNTGWDGFQVSCADKNCSIYNNTVTNFGTRKHPNQQAGIVLGGGTTGKLYNNFIDKGTGGGIHIFGIGNIKAYNNIISNVGEDGIFIGDKSTRPGYSFELINNTIVNAKNEGLRLNSDKSRNNKLYNNLIVNPGTYSSYKNKDRAFVHILKGASNYTLKENYFEKDINKVNFVNPGAKDFRKKSSSPAINEGTSVSSLGITKDFAGKNRAVGSSCDAGAYEYQDSTNPPPPDEPDDTPSGENGLNYQYYEGSWSTLPDFNKLSAKKSGTVANFTLSPRLRSEDFGFNFEGYINITTTGTYTFYTASDDGSALYINDSKVVNNDGLHKKAERSGSKYLSKGRHKIRVVFFEHTIGEVLDVKYAGPGINKKIIPSGVLFRSGGSSTPPPPTAGNGLNYQYYEGSWSTLPDFNKLSAKKSGTVANFTLSPRLRSEDFGFNFEGYINITTTGTYTFYTASDDGSALYINDSKVVNNDGLHKKAERSGSKYLSKGRHKIRVVFFEHTIGEVLDVKYAGPGINKKIIPSNALFTSKGVNTRTVATTGKVTSADSLLNQNDNLQEPLFNFKAYPNPVQDHVTIVVEGTPGETLTLRMIDALDERYFSKKHLFAKVGRILS